MAYLGRCAVHASNPRIWRRLINYGLHPNPCSSEMTGRTSTNRICTIVKSDTFFNAMEDEVDIDIFDCKDNEELFFALAVLRDDSDINQWFVFDNRASNVESPKRFWFVCKQESIEDDMCYDDMYLDCYKATAKELIVHFKGLDDDEIEINQQ